MFCFGNNSGCCDLAVAHDAPHKLWWNILSLECVWRDDGDGIGAHQPLGTGDELLFDPIALTLEAIRIKIPEVNTSPLPDEWDKAHRERGTPRLRSPSSFEPRPMNSRHYDRQNDTLTLLAMPTSTGPKTRVHVHPCLSILTRGSEVTGWRLERASTFLTSPVDDMIPSKPGVGNQAERDLLSLFLTTVDDAFVERMEQQDPTARDTLIALARKLGGAENAVAEVLKGWIPDILGRFY